MNNKTPEKRSRGSDPCLPSDRKIRNRLPDSSVCFIRPFDEPICRRSRFRGVFLNLCDIHLYLPDIDPHMPDIGLHISDICLHIPNVSLQLRNIGL